MHLVNGTGSSPSPGQPTPGVVKQDKSSRGSKTRSHPQRVRMSSRERPIGAAKGKQSNTKALRQPPPPLPRTHTSPKSPLQGLSEYTRSTSALHIHNLVCQGCIGIEEGRGGSGTQKFVHQ